MSGDPYHEEDDMRRGRQWITTVALATAVAVAAASPGYAAYGGTQRVSVASDGAQGNERSEGAQISANGRYVAFATASSLNAADTNGAADVFVRDLQTSKTERISKSSGGALGNGASFHPAISATGRYVAFASRASNLVSGDTNGRSDLFASDVFVRDRDTDNDGRFDESGAVKTTRVSVSSSGAQALGTSGSPSISADGKIVTFDSRANNLVPGDIEGSDVFAHDRSTRKTVAISRIGIQLEEEHQYNDAISGDGRWVGFTNVDEQFATGVVRDRATMAPQVRLETGYAVALSHDGRFAAGTTDYQDGPEDVVLVDRDIDQDAIYDEVGATERTAINRVAAGGEPNNTSGDISAISSNGGYVAYTSYASNLVSGDTNEQPDIFVYDRAAGTTERVSVNAGGEQANGGSAFPSISGSGARVAYESNATNLVPGDTNDMIDSFVTERR